MTSYLSRSYLYLTKGRGVATYVTKEDRSRSAALSVQDRLNLVSFFETAPADSISIVSTHRDCGAPTKEDARFFTELDYLFTKGGDEKESASASVIIGAIVKNAPNRPRVFIKLSFGRSRDLLYYERMIYCRVTQTLLKQHVTPCVVPFIGYVRVDGVFNNCGTSQQSRNVEAVCASVGKAMQVLHPNDKKLFKLKTHTAHALITELTSGRKLLDFDSRGVPSGWLATRPSEAEMRDVW